MNIVHIVSGTGGSFYCENCVRDGDLVHALRELGHEVTLVPVYLPLSVDGELVEEKAPIFFGAINTYLKERFPFLRRLPSWSGKLLDSRYLLNIAASKAGSTRAAGLEEMTYSMLRGEKGHQAGELSHMVTWLRDNVKPDVIYLANALLIGFAWELKEKIGVPIVCALEDEDIWVDDMEEHWQRQIWSTIRERSRDVDAFVAVSDYYRQRIQKQLRIPEDRMHTVHIGVDLSGHEPVRTRSKATTIGYLSRITEPLGLDILVKAFIILKSEPEFSNVKLRVTGGGTDDDISYIDNIKQELAQSGHGAHVDWVTHFDRNSRLEFLRSLDLLSVPARKKEAYGLFQIEALAAGVPTVLPHKAAYPEITELTGGGVTYESNNPQPLADQLAQLLRNPDKINELAQRGQATVFKLLSNIQTAENMVKIYQEISRKAGE